MCKTHFTHCFELNFHKESLKNAGLKNLEHSFSYTRVFTVKHRIISGRCSSFKAANTALMVISSWFCKTNVILLAYSLSYQAAKHWNDLPDNIATSDNLNELWGNLKRIHYQPRGTATEFFVNHSIFIISLFLFY